MLLEFKKVAHMISSLFVTPPSTHAENIGCLGLAFLDKILHSECGNETDLFV